MVAWLAEICVLSKSEQILSHMAEVSKDHTMETTTFS